MSSRNPIGALAMGVVLLIPRVSNAQKFGTQCHPFKTIETVTDSDRECPAQGDSVQGKKPDTYDQDLVKNNFCAPEPVRDITITQLADLQRTTVTQLKVKQGTPPDDRSVLHSAKLGQFQEGNLVRLTAYVLMAETADYESTGESVNCNIGLRTPGQSYTKDYVVPRNDIHIALAARGATDECSSVTAEITPHMRPQDWNETAVSNLKGKLVRVTGQPMYDGSHHVCVGGKAGKSDPARQALWEIHPVYNLEVCQKDSGGSCADQDWKQL